MIKLKYCRFVLLSSILFLCSCSEKQAVPEDDFIDYSDQTNWAYLPEMDTGDIDVFFLAPTVFGGDSVYLNMSLNDEETKANFIGAINMEKFIYHSDISNFYAPFYKQVGFICYQMSYNNPDPIKPEVEEAFNTAYLDVESAFDYYLVLARKLPFL